MTNAFLQLQYLALSPSELRARQDWFPSFVCATILATTAIVYLDILGACPTPLREQIWGVDWHNRVREMRHWGYGMLISVLLANTKGVNPLKLDCWTEEPAVEDPFIIETPKSYASGKKPQLPEGGGGSKPKILVGKSKVRAKLDTPKDRERIVLLGQSPAAMDGLFALKDFQSRFSKDLKAGEDMFSKELYLQAMMRPVGSLWKVFEMQA